MLLDDADDEDGVLMLMMDLRGRHQIVTKGWFLLGPKSVSFNVTKGKLLLNILRT